MALGSATREQVAAVEGAGDEPVAAAASTMPATRVGRCRHASSATCVPMEWATIRRARRPRAFEHAVQVAGVVLDADALGVDAAAPSARGPR
jgi:hypothetical protein